MPPLICPLRLRPLAPPCSPILFPVPPPRFRRSLPASCSSGKNEATHGIDKERRSGAAILWFKHDLRTDDHPGLLAASEHGIVVPLYVFDRRILSRFSDEMVELIVLAVEDLRKSLEEQGSNLMIRFGDAECVIKGLVKEVKATRIIAELELEYRMSCLVDTVKETLAGDPLLDWSPDVVLWQTSSFDMKNVEDLLQSYDDLRRKLPESYGSPISPPLLPGFIEEFNWGHLPPMSYVKEFKNDTLNNLKESWVSIKDNSADFVIQKEHIDSIQPSTFSLSEGCGQIQNQIQGKRLKDSSIGTSEGNNNMVAGGTNAVLNALDGYLKVMERSSGDDRKEVHRRLEKTETQRGASFSALFGAALQIGIISRRRVFYEAMKYEKEQNAGFIFPFRGATANVTSAFETICSMEWYCLLGKKSQSSSEGSYPTRLWRWNGYLIQYTVVGYEGPAVLLVHGFGAFMEHYRNNFSSIANGGNQVWGITLLGFGRSEKPNIIYTELMWAELLRDFIVDVVGEPVHLIGNSFGGYLVAIVGALWPALAKSIILMNTAGFIIPEYSSLLFSKERDVSGAAWFGARILLQFLRLSLKTTVRSCYPTRTERADDWLIEEMLRAVSCQLYLIGLFTLWIDKNALHLA
ncbi:hypothetical protein Dimus_028310 [Dionaea muscipula]